MKRKDLKVGMEVAVVASNTTNRARRAIIVMPKLHKEVFVHFSLAVRKRRANKVGVAVRYEPGRWYREFIPLNQIRCTWAEWEELRQQAEEARRKNREQAEQEDKVFNDLCEEFSKLAGVEHALFEFHPRGVTLRETDMRRIVQRLRVLDNVVDEKDW